MVMQVEFKPGTTIKVWLSTYWHYGIVGYQSNVIHNSKFHQRVVCESMQGFSAGKRVYQCSEIISDSPLSALTKAYQAIGYHYCLWTQNCEHFVRWSHGLKVESVQMQKAVLVAVFGLISVAAKNRALSLAGLVAAIATLSANKPVQVSAASLIGLSAIHAMGEFQ